MRKLLLLIPVLALAGCGSQAVDYSFKAPGQPQASIYVYDSGEVIRKGCPNCKEDQVGVLSGEQMDRLQRALAQADLGSLNKSYGRPSPQSLKVTVSSGGHSVTAYLPSGGPAVGVPPGLVSLEAELRPLTNLR